MDETKSDKNPTFWSRFRNIIKENPLQFYPITIVCISSMVSIFFIENPSIKSFILMITWTAIGFQWIGIARNHEKRKIKNIKSDKEHLEWLATGMIEGVKFLVPFRPWLIKRLWYRIREKRILSLYAYKDDAHHSYTKICLSKKDLFYLRLQHCIDTTDVGLAIKGMEYLSENNKSIQAIL